MAEELIYPVESYAIKGACMSVYSEMGVGFLEAVYQECLTLELTRRGIPFVAQKPLALIYRGALLQQVYRPDFICYDKIIVEIKAVSKLLPEHQAQLRNYLKATRFELGFLMNFGHYPQLEQIRMVNSKGRAEASKILLDDPDPLAG